MLFRSLTIIGTVCILLAGALFAADTQRAPILFHHEEAEDPRLTQLREEYDFAAHASAGTNEMEEMALLKDWVYARIPYGLNFGDAELRDSRTILRRAGRGDAFLCTTKATVLVQCAASMGWTARLVFLKRPTGEEHAGADIWSNQHRKWVYFDPTWNIHLELRGMPLGIHEIRREWKKNRGRDLVYLFGAGKHVRRYGVRDLPVRRRDSRIWRLLPLDRAWPSYADKISVLGRNDFFSSGGSGGKARWDPMYEMAKKARRRNRIQSFFFDGKGYPPGSLFHDLNRVDIIPEGGAGTGGGPVRLRLDAFGENNYTPNFMEYLVKINEQDWKIAGDRIEIMPARGENVVRARIMNRFGVVGPVTEMRFDTRQGARRTPPRRGLSGMDNNAADALNN